MLVGCVAVSYSQGVGGRKVLGIIVWACHKVSPRRHFGSGRRPIFTILRGDGQIGL